MRGIELKLFAVGLSFTAPWRLSTPLCASLLSLFLCCGDVSLGFCCANNWNLFSCDVVILRLMVTHHFAFSKLDGAIPFRLRFNLHLAIMNSIITRNYLSFQKIVG